MIPVEGYAWARGVQVLRTPLKLWVFHPFHQGTRVPHPAKQVVPAKSRESLERVNSWSSLNPWCATHQLSLTQKFSCFKNAFGQISTSFIHKEDNTVFKDTKERNLSVQPAPWSTDKRWGNQNQPHQLTFDLENSSSLFSPITTSLRGVQFSCLHSDFTQWKRILSGEKNYILQRGIINTLCHHVLFQCHMNVRKSRGRPS